MPDSQTPEDVVRELIKRRRRQILVHSYIYYRLQETIISNDFFDSWATELIELQQLHPDLSEEVELFDDFRNFSSVRDSENLHFEEHPHLHSLATALIDKAHPNRRMIMDYFRSQLEFAELPADPSLD